MQEGCALRDAALSPFLKPEYRAVTAAGVDPYVVVWLEAVIVSGAWSIVTDPPP